MDRTKLDKFVGMLGSEHEGEQVNAARFIRKMATEAKLSMVELFQKAYGGGAERIVYQEKVVYRDRPASASPPPRQPPPRGSAKPSKAYGHSSMEAKISTVLAYYSSKLTDWEKDFLDDLRPRVAQGIELTPKQRQVLGKIFSKVGL